MCFFGGQASAQTTDAGGSGLEEVVVTGFRSSLEKALELKRNSSAVVDSIVAEDIAKFPDNNLAESIQRVPGVTISRDQGEGRAISVRGLGADFTRVRINGMEAQASTDGIAGGVNRGRGFDFNVFASELFSRIDVRKSASADVPEGSLGATVDLHTGHPFDYDGLKIAVSGQANYNDLSDRTGSRAALLVSDTFADDTLGTLFSVAYSKTPIEFQQVNSGNWNQGSGDGGFCRPTSGTGGICDVPAADLARSLQVYNVANSATTYNPRFYRYVDSIGETQRLGLTGSLQWQPAATTLLSLDALFSSFQTKRDDYTIEAIGLSRGASQGGKPETLVRDVAVGANNTAVYGLYDNVDMRSEHLQDDFTTDFGQLTLHVQQDLTERLSLDALVGYSYSEFENYNDFAVQIDRFNVDGYSYDIRGSGQNAPAINYGFDVANPANWYFGPRVQQPGGTGPTGPEIRLRPNYTDNSYTNASAGLKFALNDTFTLRGGLDWKKYEFEAHAFRFVSGEADFPAPSGGLAGLTETFCGLGSINVPSPSPRCWTVANTEAFRQLYNIDGNAGRTAQSMSVAAARADNRSVEERDSAVYFMTEFKHDFGSMHLRGDVGIRGVRTEQSSTFFTNVPTTVNASGFLLTTVDRDYDNWLPSLNLVVEPLEDLLIRFGAAKVMARPPLGNLAAATSVSVAGGSRSINTGNTNLDPYRATTYDLSFEWYPARGSIVSLGLFYKDISTYVQSITRIAPYSTTGLPDSLIANTGVSASDDFAITTVTNTPGGPLQGLEVNYQQALDFIPAPFDGFGLLLNYTYVESEIDYFTSTSAGATTVTADLLNLSKNSYNATLYYEKGPFQARVSTNYRDKYLRSVPGPFNMDVAGVPSRTYLDFSTSYQLNDYMSLSLEGINLGNEETVSWVDSAAQRVEDYRVGGRQFIAGVRLTF